YSQARPLLEEALEIDKAKLGADHPYVGGDLKNLGLIFKKEGDYQKAEDYFRKSLNIFEQRLPKNHKYITETLTNLGEVLTYNGSFEEAGQILNELLEIQKEALDAGHWKIARTRILLEINLFELSKFDTARSLLKNGHDKLKLAQRPENEYTRKALQYLKIIREK
ncbi:MAG: tetratricopeptide repeat protein, partial [Balneolaceae bacterium]|nr:tetratricopeptide repeat protein [Balneolaceae bacterium]